jgi:UPF0716 protein FxsA
MGKVADQIGFWDTAIFLILSGVFGIYLAKHQGNVVLSRVQQCMAEGRLPTLEMVDGLLIFLGGLLFVFPGFISDIVGLVLVFPLTRWIVRWFVLAGMQMQVKDPRRPKPSVASAGAKRPQGMDKGHAVDAEVVE